ncbi:S1 RNA-binding domain-containing protein [Nonomuraea wenchangensis]|uniref:S1 RNA-binding domain-containing protein n=1 Tax=Nonomuraea wenchangensis TaxID=568860 RepID=UPI003D9F0386
MPGSQDRRAWLEAGDLERGMWLLTSGQTRVRAAGAMSFELGQVCRGVVSSIKPFGVFVDLGGVDGMVNMAELSWRRFDDPSEVVEIGDGIEGLVHISEFPDGELPSEGHELLVRIADINLGRHRARLELA